MMRKLFITPAETPDDLICRVLWIPNSQDWLAVVNAAVLALSQWWQYERLHETDLTLQEAAEQGRLMYERYLAQGGECVGDCDKLLLCLDEQDVQDKLIDVLNGAGFAGGAAAGQPYPLSNADTTIASALEGGCSASDRYGLCYFLVGAVHQSALDLLDKIQVLVDIAEVSAQIVASIPILGNFAAAAVKIAQYTLTYVIGVYDAAYDESIREQLACLYYCQMAGQCEITVGQIYQIYRDIMEPYSPPPPTTSHIVEFAEWIYTLALTTDLDIVAALHLLIFEVWRRGGSFVGKQVRTLQIAAELSTPISVPEGCECLEEWCYEWDLTEGDGGLVLFDIATYPGTQEVGVYTSGVGWEDTRASYGTTSARGLAVRKTFSLVTITRAQMVFDCSVATKLCSNDVFYMGRMIAKNGSTTIADNYEPDNMGTVTDELVELVVGQGVTELEFIPGVCGGGSCSSGDRGGSQTLKLVRLYGVGTNPFGTDNCT